MVPCVPLVWSDSGLTTAVLLNLVPVRGTASRTCILYTVYLVPSTAVVPLDLESHLESHRYMRLNFLPFVQPASRCRILRTSVL
jgi:hypothetical protein